MAPKGEPGFTIGVRVVPRDPAEYDRGEGNEPHKVPALELPPAGDVEAAVRTELDKTFGPGTWLGGFYRVEVDAAAHPGD